LDSEVLKKYIFGGHVAEYMESLEEEDDERFKKQLVTYLSADAVGSEDIEDIYIAGHAAIHEDLSFKPTDKSKDWKSESTKLMDPKLTHARRKERIAAKI
ncbi:ribosomal L18 C-terminal region-domain-containing protein, partial [Mycena vulgaris]